MKSFKSSQKGAIKNSNDFLEGTRNFGDIPNLLILMSSQQKNNHRTFTAKRQMILSVKLNQAKTWQK